MTDQGSTKITLVPHGATSSVSVSSHRLKVNANDKVVVDGVVATSADSNDDAAFW